MMGFSGFPAAGGSQAGYNAFQISQDRLALANQVTGQENPAEVALLHQKDKQMTLNKVKENFNYEYNTAWTDHAHAREKKNQEQQRRLLGMGSVFA